MTLTVAPLGEAVKCKDLWARSVVYMMAASVSGAIVGFIITALVYVLTFWIPMSIKIWLLILLSAMYLLKEIGWTALWVPQVKWQIPTSWMSQTPLKNMAVWGLILGAGIFTYSPYSVFYISYFYIGLLYPPYVGLLWGVMYGISRCLPTILLAGLRKEDGLWQRDKWFHWLNAAALGILLIYLIVYL